MAAPQQSKASKLPLPPQALAVFLVAALALVFLRANDYLTVDGGLRALDVYGADRPFLHPNNHLLYAVDVFGWTKLARCFGVPESDPVAFLRVAEAMNSVAGAGVLAIFYCLSMWLTRRVGVACLATALYGLSRAFLVHATHGAEPMVGVLHSAAATAAAAYGAARGRKGMVFLAGALLALALATYQSMLLIAPALLVIVAGLPEGAAAGLRPRAARVALFLAGLGCGAVSIFSAAYYCAGAHSLRAIVSGALRLEPALTADGGFQLLRAASVPAGLAYALFPCLPRECTGFRCLAGDGNEGWLVVAGVAVLLAVLWIGGLLWAARRLWGGLTHCEKLGILACGAGAGCAGLPLVWWLPTYDKLWLQPLACLWLASAILFHAALRANGGGRMAARVLLVSGCAALTLVAVPNLARSVRLSRAPTPYLEEARQIAAIVKPRDLLVGDWNDVFLLYQAFWARRANAFNVPTLAIRNGAGTLDLLKNRVAETAGHGGDVFFIGLLDVPFSGWGDAFEGQALPYDSFDDYRRGSTPVMALVCRGKLVTLRRMALPLPQNL